MKTRFERKDARARKLLAKYPNMPSRDNIMNDKVCRKCGNRDEFKILVTTMATMTDDGTDANTDCHEWDGKSMMQCQVCRHTACMDDFWYPDLDLMITKQREERRTHGAPSDKLK